MTATPAAVPGSAFLRVPVGLPRLADRIVIGATVLAWIVLLWDDRLSGGAADSVIRVTFGTAAMMLPLALPATRHVIASTFRSSRALSVTAFLAAFVGVWVTVGLAATIVFGLLERTGFTPPNVLVGALLIAAGWQALPWKRVSLRDCHLTVPLAPRGWRSSFGCLKFGGIVAARCVASCCGLMLPMFVAGSGHLFFGLLAMAGAVGERRLLVLRRESWLLSGVALGLAVLTTTSGADPGSALVGWFCAIPQRP